MRDFDIEKKIRDMKYYKAISITGNDDISNKKREKALEHVRLFDNIYNALKNDVDSKFIQKFIDDFDIFIEKENHTKLLKKSKSIYQK